MSKRQSGYVLMAMLIAMLAVGGAWVGAVGVNSVAQRDTGMNFALTRDVQALIDARQSLLSYSTIYPNLYGPGGAGPAHLPCPDTDGYGVASAQVSSGELFRRDGSNPPCLSTHSAFGKLPRHTVLPGHRYQFHSELWQRFDYQVGAHLVNNPINRIVNTATPGKYPERPGLKISLRGKDDPGKTRAQVVLTQSALLEVSAVYVAAWIIERVAKNRRSDCVSSPAPLSEVEDVHIAPTQNDCLLANFECEQDELLVLLLDEPVAPPGECLVDSLNLYALEGVPARRHWLIRNQWLDVISIEYTQACKPAPVVPRECFLSLQRQSRIPKEYEGSGLNLLWDRRS